jgi:uncharacterized protein YecE (DUF72 family)
LTKCKGKKLATVICSVWRGRKFRLGEDLRYTPRVNHPPILLGTSSFTAAGWSGSFYPRGLKPSDYLAFYAERFHTVEVDSTFYACRTARTVSNWAARTPEGFIFSVKVPQTITHGCLRRRKSAPRAS